MCGIAGFFDLRGSHERDRATAIAERMADALIHRGPDDRGVWTDPECGVAFGFRRLAILDLSPLGKQPMASSSGRYHLVFNGEIYNFPTLREELQRRGHAFRGSSDTEVALAAIEGYGFVETLERMQGMFALALWDREQRTLELARDRIGEKPLYYGTARGGQLFLFGSELRAIRAHPEFEPRIARSALLRYMRYGYVPTPLCIYEGVRKLPPGTRLVISRDGDGDPSPITYYSLRDVAERGIATPLQVTDDEATELVDTELRRAVRQQMVADVPLGAFLSGGIDSSTVVALMQTQSSRPVKTFTIGFHEAAYDEARWAKQIAAHLGTAHTEVFVTPQEALDVIPHLPAIYDEPFADSSQIPTYLVSRLARSEVTVALTGDGGDEMFGGYPRYEITRRMEWPLAVPGRRVAAQAVHSFLGMINRPGMAPTRDRRFLDWARRRTEHLRAADLDTFYAMFMSLALEPEQLVPGVAEPRGVLPLAKDVLARGNATERAMLADGLQYLPDDILVKVDRAAMAVSLESRVPLLDHKVIELAWRLPYRTKVKGQVGKAVLRSVLAKYVPESMFNRPKMGFGVPIVQWLRGPLRDWAEHLLDERRLRREGYLGVDFIRRRWNAYLAGTRDWHSMLWNVLMWQAWLEASQPLG